MSRAALVPIVDDDSPWPGLVAFSENFHQFFFGRTVELDDLFRRVRRETLTVLYAQSGLGKTSLLQAGLFPKLRLEGFLPIPIRLDFGEVEQGVRTDADPPGRQIAQAMARALKERGLTEASDPLAETGPWEYLHNVNLALPDETGSPLIPVLIFDQFEELFTLGAGRHDEAKFADQVAELLGDLIENRAPRSLERALKQNPALVDRYDFTRANYRVLLSFREDFLSHMHGLRGEIPSIILNNVRLTRFDRRQALEVVEKPAANKKIVTRTVAEAIVQAVAGKDAGGETTGTHRTGESRAADAVSRERPGQKLEVEPALLSIFCRVLNGFRLERKEASISLDLVASNREKVMRDFYLSCFNDLSPPPEPGVKAFVEDYLLTAKGYRDRLTVERANEILVSEYHGRPDELETLVARRLLQIEERGKTQQIELTHDVLAPIALSERAERKRNEELRRIEREAAEARQRASRDRKRALVIGAGLTLGLVIAAGSASVFMNQARDLKLANATSDSARAAAETARQASDRNAFRAESLLAVSQTQTTELERRNQKEATLTRDALTARDQANDAAALAKREEERSTRLLVSSCDQTLALLGLMADSAADHPEMAGVYRNFLGTSEGHVSQLRKQDSTALCPIKLEARVRTIQVASLRDQRQAAAAFRKAQEALPSVRAVAGQTDPDSRWLASVLYLELASQLYFVDTNRDRRIAQQAAREGIAVSKLVDPAKDVNAQNRLARLHQYLSNSLFNARQWEEARTAAEGGLAVIRDGKTRTGQDRPRLLYTESQTHIRLAEIDSATGHRPAALAHYVEATRAAAERAAQLKTPEAERWLARIYEWRGEFTFRLGDSVASRTAYDSAAFHQEAVFERLRREGSPAQVTAAGDSLITLQRTIAQLELILGDTTGALDHYRERVTTAQTMTQVQSTLRNRRQLSAMYNQLGDALRAARRYPGADSAFREQLSLDSLFMAAEGRTPSNLDNLAYSFGKMGQISFDRGRFVEARYYGRQRAALRADLYTRATAPGGRAGLADTTRSNLASALGSQSWYELFGGIADSAVAFAARGFALDSVQNYTLPNRANGLLLAGRLPELEAMLKTYEPKFVETNPIIQFRCAVIRDTRVLRARGFATAEQLAVMERLTTAAPPCQKP